MLTFKSSQRRDRAAPLKNNQFPSLRLTLPTLGHYHCGTFRQFGMHRVHTVGTMQVQGGESAGEGPGKKYTTIIIKREKAPSTRTCTRSMCKGKSRLSGGRTKAFGKKKKKNQYEQTKQSSQKHPWRRKQ